MTNTPNPPRVSPRLLTVVDILTDYGRWLQEHRRQAPSGPTSPENGLQAPDMPPTPQKAPDGPQEARQ